MTDSDFPMAIVLVTVGSTAVTVAGVFAFGGHAVRLVQRVVFAIYGELVERVTELEAQIEGSDGLRARLRRAENDIAFLKGSVAHHEDSGQ